MLSPHPPCFSLLQPSGSFPWWSARHCFKFWSQLEISGRSLFNFDFTLSKYSNITKMTVSISGCVLSALLFKLKNVTADGVSCRSLLCVINIVLNHLCRRDFCWGRCTLTVLRTSQTLRVPAREKRRGSVSTHMSALKGNIGSFAALDLVLNASPYYEGD